jgi:orotate phosphoribosyltransferase
MKNVDDLIASAAELAERGLSKGEIADELNVSRETASWLVERSGATSEPDEAGEERAPVDAGTSGPDDIHVDWSAIGRDSKRLTSIGRTLADLMAGDDRSVDLTVGIEKAGVPLATVVANELDTDLAAYAPRKHQWEEGDIEDLGGSFSRNFAQVRGRDCYIVDDTITSGTTMGETIEAVREAGGNPVACVVLVDKQGVDEVDGVPVDSLINVVRVGRDHAVEE